MKLFALSLCILFVSCQEYEGKLEVNQTFTFNRGVFKDSQAVGKYDATLKVITNKKIKIKANDKTITIKTKKNQKFPDFDINQIHEKLRRTCPNNTLSCNNNSVVYTKKFNFLEGQINQPFNLDGLVEVKSLGKDEISEIESCLIYPNIQECQRYARERGYDPGRSYSMCNNGTPGLRDVTYTGFKYHTKFQAVITQNMAFKGSLQADKNQLVKEYSYFGECIKKRR